MVVALLSTLVILCLLFEKVGSTKSDASIQFALSLVSLHDKIEIVAGLEKLLAPVAAIIDEFLIEVAFGIGSGFGLFAKLRAVLQLNRVLVRVIEFLQLFPSYHALIKGVSVHAIYEVRDAADTLSVPFRAGNRG